MALELKVSEEQVKGFLLRGFADYLEDSESDEPTNGIANYSRHALGLLDNLCKWWKFIPFPDEIKGFFDRLIPVIGTFQGSLYDLRMPFGHKEESAREHYSSLKELEGLHAENLALIQKYQDQPELKQASEELKRQIKVANLLFDPSKRNEDFRHKIWGNPLEFKDYLDREED